MSYRGIGRQADEFAFELLAGLAACHVDHELADRRIACRRSQRSGSLGPRGATEREAAEQDAPEHGSLESLAHHRPMLAHRNLASGTRLATPCDGKSRNSGR